MSHEPDIHLDQDGLYTTAWIIVPTPPAQVADLVRDALRGHRHLVVHDVDGDEIGVIRRTTMAYRSDRIGILVSADGAGSRLDARSPLLAVAPMAYGPGDIREFFEAIRDELSRRRSTGT